jgi:PDZ domain
MLRWCDETTGSQQAPLSQDRKSRNVGVPGEFCCALRFPEIESIASFQHRLHSWRKEDAMKFLSTTTLIIACFGVLAAFFVAMATIGTRRFKIKDYGTLRFVFGAMVVVALDLALVAILDISSTPYAGFEVTPDYKVIHVAPNGPAAMAGLRDGDFIYALDGIRTDHLHALARQSRARIGEEVAVTVHRDQARLDLLIKQVALPGKDLFLAWSGTLMALVMLALGLVVYWKSPNKVTTLYFLSNLSFALAFMKPPYLETAVLRNIVAFNFILFITMGFAFFLHLAVVFPRAKPLITDGSFWEMIIYVPAPLMAINYLGLRLLQPRADLLVNRVLHEAFALLVLACLVLTLAAIVHSFRTAKDPETWRAVRLLLPSAMLGILPALAVLLLETFRPTLNLPGEAYYPLLAILVPLSFGWAIWKYKRPVESRGLRRVA